MSLMGLLTQGPDFVFADVSVSATFHRDYFELGRYCHEATRTNSEAPEAKDLYI